MFLEDDDLDALNAPLRPDEKRWDEDVQFVLARDMGWVGSYAAPAAAPTGPAVA